jgi:hypothetical protein
MPQIDFSNVLGELKDGLFQLAKDNLQNFVSDAKSDAEDLLNKLKADLEKWTEQLANGEITLDDFQFLLEQKKILVEMNALKQAGLAQIRIDKFKNDAFNLILNIVKGLI